MTSVEGIRAELLGLRGCERVVWSEGAGDSDPIAIRLRLLAAFATRTSDALEYGEPRMLTLSYDDRMIAMALEPGGGLLAVISHEPSAIGLAMVKLRQWLLTRGGA
ncbi:MAG: hypothetical protein R6X02_35630 [Enhygromyxa sp.]